MLGGFVWSNLPHQRELCFRTLPMAEHCSIVVLLNGKFVVLASLFRFLAMSTGTLKCVQNQNQYLVGDSSIRYFFFSDQVEHSFFAVLCKGKFDGNRSLLFPMSFVLT
jgi:hypothetical protein